MECNVCGCAVQVELDVEGGGVSMEMQATRHSICALVGADVGDSIWLEE